jgi:metal-sulfur cluster biosynthetic enzyme
MIDSKKLHRVILERLSKVIDPETGVDVVRMQLIKDLTVDKDGNVSYTFCPSSPFCPIAVPLSNTIQQAVAEVPGVGSQNVKVIGFALSDELTQWLKQALDARQSSN